jgi:hypothetical protein
VAFRRSPALGGAALTVLHPSSRPLPKSYQQTLCVQPFSQGVIMESLNDVLVYYKLAGIVSGGLGIPESTCFRGRAFHGWTIPSFFFL